MALIVVRCRHSLVVDRGILWEEALVAYHKAISEEGAADNAGATTAATADTDDDSAAEGIPDDRAAEPNGGGDGGGDGGGGLSWTGFYRSKKMIFGYGQMAIPPRLTHTLLFR